MSVEMNALFKRVREQLGRVVFGQEGVIDLLLAGFFSSGHVLLEGLPGTAKTLLVRTLAASLDLRFQRVQMTPDLLPNDITGSSIYRPDTWTFEFRPGPVFANFLLADEINRASAKTQSALLEAMQELTVTHDGTTHPLPDPFMVFATQNPVEQEGTYPLPLAQLDRFMLHIRVDYPDPEREDDILRGHHATQPHHDWDAMGVQPIVGVDDVIAARTYIRQTFVRDEVIAYVRRLIHATRQHDALMVGASPRAGLMLLMAAKSMARFEERDFVTPDDIHAVFAPALRHRVVLAAMAEIEGITPDDALRDILTAVEVPR